MENKPKKPISKKQQQVEACLEYVCDNLCKHTGKKESALIKQCNQCQLEALINEVRKR